MRIATVPARKRKELITIGILILGLPLLLYASYQAYQFFTSASVEAKPNNVLVSNLTTSSVTISWVTEKEATGSVIPVLNGTEKYPVVDKRGSGKRYTHYVELDDLDPNTTYEFIIVSGSSKYTDEGSKNFSFKTAPITADTPTPNPIHGSVDVSGDDIMLFALPKDKSTYPVSAIMPSGGNWIMDVSALRKVSDKSMANISDSTNMTVIAVSGLNEGAVVEGSFSEIFDSNGKLKDVYPLTLSTNETIYTNFSPVSMLEAYAVAEEEEEVDTTTSTTTTPTTNNQEVITEEEEESDEDDSSLEREYRIVQQLQWIDLVTSDGSTVTGSVGEDSLRVTNLTDTGFTVIWVSESQEQGYVKYGTSKEDLSNEANDERDGLTSRGNYYVHVVSLERLQPEMDYYLEIISGEDVYDNEGDKYVVTTLATLSSPPPFESITGVLEGVPDHNEAVIIANITDGDENGSSEDSLSVSTIVDENGKWILSIADSRTGDGSEYYEYTSGDTLNIEVVSTVQSEIKEETMEGISDRDVEVTIESTSESGVAYTKVEPLDGYGVLGASSLTSDGTTNEDNAYVAPEGSETPETGLLDNLLYLLLLSLGLISTGIYIYRKNMTKDCRKDKMVKNL